ncbi:tfiih basal transcription factor complex p47 subunit [Diplodia corticola]|uniref:General transcription and DNA repair factor IIH n=1 Tax=Diplodia corticola TaxID=236234 RepID=A0A1J9RTV3_9PEZI|nr:tfiih basal transcription factor complex p47 subunit [Diplodia corticola]OJD31855.1 tfiih basal transcription factor complex p47 subunit [Diplodia corticola]
MADSGDEYVYGSDDQRAGGAPGKKGRAKKGGGQTSRRWEQGVHADAHALKEAADGRLLPDEEDNPEAKKRKRLRQDTKPFQRGIIRHVVLVIDQSEAMLEKDFKPTRYSATLKYAQEYVREFFEQNPISQLSVMSMYDGLCNRVSELSGNPNDHIGPLQKMRDTRHPNYQDPRGSPSLQNALEQARAALYHTPSHGTREVIIVLGALLSLDPGDIFKTIASCVKNNVRVNIIGMGGRLRICQEICSRTNGGDENVYSVAVDQLHLRDLLLATTTPPVIRQTTTEAPNPASLLKMGFPSRVVENVPTICACHGILTRGGYLCSQCQAKVCSLPTGCPSCGLTLILSTHLARSYHHLFPLQNWTEVTWERARQVGSTECRSCLSPFPHIPSSTSAKAKKGGGGGGGGNNAANGESNGQNGVWQRPQQQKKKTEGAGASESSRYECESCGNHFCVDCDVYCHEIVHNCPGCLSKVLPDGENGGNIMDGVAATTTASNGTT